MRFALLLLLVGLLNGELVDRVAVAVGNKVITESEIGLRIRLTAFQNTVVPDYSLAARRLTAQRLVEQKLIEREMEIGHYPNLPQERAKALMGEYLNSNFNADAPDMAAVLMEYALVPQDLKTDLARQSDLLTFLNLRFRPAVQVTDEDARKYFEQKTPPDSRNDQTFATLRGSIERQLTTEQADRDLDAWLADQQQRTRIVYVDRDLAPEAPK